MHNFIGKNVRIFPLCILLINCLLLTNFGLTILINFGLELAGHFEPKESISKFPMVFELYQVVIHNYLSQNVSIPPNHLLLTRTKSIFTTSHQILY